MKSSLLNQKFGIAALVLLSAGFLGLMVPGTLHWNRWIHVYFAVRSVVWLPFVLTFLGFWLDRRKTSVVLALVGSVGFLVAPVFSKLATIMPRRGPGSAIFCFVDQSGSPLTHITLYPNGNPVELPTSDYWRGVAKFAVPRVIDTPDGNLAAEVGFVDGRSMPKQQLTTVKNGQEIRYAVIFIRPERTFETMVFY